MYIEVSNMKRSVSFLVAAVMALLLIVPMKVSGASDRKAGVVSVSSGGLNVRSGASTSSAVVGTLSKGSYVTLLEKSGSWWKVEYANGKYGYCHGDYITSVSGSGAAVKLNSGSLNVRSGAGTSYAKTGSLSNGAQVVVLSQSGGWSRIVYHGTKTGYVSSQYLSTGSTSGGGVSLNVPSFKQTDSRWANTYIGSSGKTMAQIGCATTAIAMMESYRTGTTIYPNAMAKKLSYTSGGSVYWPSHYKTVTSSSGYLSGIRSQIAAGKPVLFGAKNSHGGQHWVVITGYSGSGTAASDFTIHDPGSNSRTNLGQFLSAYPTFYKYFYY